MNDLELKQARGTVFSIERCSLHDGPGVRTTVFLKGCTLQCIWCHNPEGLKKEVQLRYFKEKCVGCGKCAAVCPNGVHRFEKNFSWEDGGRAPHVMERSLCAVCGMCSEACPSGALVMEGNEKGAGEIFETIKKDLPFYRRTGGGVTLSGGEPLMQPEFAAELLTLCRNAGIHTAIETAGFVPWQAFERVIPVTDLFLFDYKASSEEDQRRFTGGSRERILENLSLLNEEMRKRETQEADSCGIWLRCPIIPGINDMDQHFDEIRRLQNIYDRIVRTDLMPYHELGKGKWEQLGIEYDLKELKAPDEDVVRQWRRKVM